ncbi:glycosyltransferase family 4 protein [Bradyrhizobium sp. SYSU BS000235]|uniref:glycosyltransferase family 4 protein n=1 Tax=Bradyrhizobium sp. SYSU BS000235 TaxID=3411332 RepID=UPI003C76D737
MDILVVSQHFWPENFRINALVGALHDAGCRVTVLTGQPNYPDGKIFPGYGAWRIGMQTHPAGYPIMRVPVVPRGSGSALRLGLNYLSFIGTSILFGGWKLRKSRFDVVFVYGPSPALQALTGVYFGAIHRIPLIFWVQDLWPESLSSTGYVRNRFILGGVAKIVNWIYRRCDLILVQSRSFLAHVTSVSGSTPVIYYPNPGDVKSDPAVVGTFDPVRIPDGFNVVFAGNVGTVQSVDTILDAAGHLASAPDVNIVILGNGSKFDWTAEEVKKRSLSNVHLLGRVGPDAAIEAMSRSDALLITLNDSEGLNRTVPSKLSTYLGVGKPVLASMNGEGADIVKASGAGIVCKAENAEELAKAILQMRDMPKEARHAMGLAGRRWYDKHFELGTLTHTLIHHFRETAARYKNQRDAAND